MKFVSALSSCSIAGFAERIVREALQNRPAVKRLFPALLRAGKKAREVLRLSASLKTEFGSEIEIALGLERADDDPYNQLVYALELLEKIAVADDLPLVFYVDEFQEIESSDRRFGEPEHLTKSMRTVLQRSRHVTRLFAGSIEHMMRDIFGADKRALYKFGGSFAVEAIDHDAWVEGLRSAFGEDETSISDAALELILTTTGGAPRATMLIAQQTLVVAVAQGQWEVGATEVAQGIEYAQSAELPSHQIEMDRIRRLRVHALTIALRIARGDAPYAVALDPKQIERPINALRDKGIVTQTKDLTWIIVDPLFRRYLAKYSDVAAVLPEST